MAYKTPTLTVCGISDLSACAFALVVDAERHLIAGEYEFAARRYRLAADFAERAGLENTSQHYHYMAGKMQAKIVEGEPV